MSRDVTDLFGDDTQGLSLHIMVVKKDSVRSLWLTTNGVVAALQYVETVGEHHMRWSVAAYGIAVR